MAIYGIGTFYNTDVSREFISKNKACIGWNYENAPSLHKVLKYIKIGDLMYIKSHPPNEGLIIKAVGIVVDDKMSEKDLGTCIEVDWVWQGYEVLGRVGDRYNVRNTTIYEEMNPDIQQKVIDLLLTSIDR